MIVCPVCNYENMQGSLLCAKCHHLLIKVDVSQQKMTMPLSSTGMGEAARQIIQQVSLLAPDEIELHISGGEKPLILRMKEQVMLGRHTPNVANAQFIDLVPYGGYKKGISRAHAVIQRTDKGLTITDLASSNGSWLNGIRLVPYGPKTLKSSDQIRLGQLEIDFYCA